MKACRIYQGIVKSQASISTALRPLRIVPVISCVVLSLIGLNHAAISSTSSSEMVDASSEPYWEEEFQGNNGAILKITGPPGAEWRLNVTITENETHHGPRVHAVSKVGERHPSYARIIHVHDGTEPLLMVSVGPHTFEAPINVDPAEGWLKIFYGSRLPESGSVTIAFINIGSTTFYEFRADGKVSTIFLEATSIGTARGQEYNDLYIRANAFPTGIGLTHGTYQYIAGSSSIGWFPALYDDDYSCSDPMNEACAVATNAEESGMWNVSATADLDTEPVDQYDFLVAEFPTISL